MLRIHAHYYHNHNGNSVEILGSDGVTPKMDGRYSVETCHEKAREHAERLRHVRSDITGYRLFAGHNYSDSYAVSGFRPV